MKTLTVKELQPLIQGLEDRNDPLWEKLQDDPRVSVQQLLKRQVAVIEEQQQLISDHHDRLKFETAIYEQHPQALIAGIDEVGRGPLAGPVVAAAVILPTEVDALIGVTDSKQLSRAKRQEFVTLIQATAIDYSVAIIDAATIDRLNIYQATKYAMETAVAKLTQTPDALLIDAMEIKTPIQQQALVKGDQHSLSIAAASILAKETRDQLMEAYAELYPEFGFDAHKGYGTAKHRQALERYGYTPLHRRSFAPISTMTKTYS